MSSFALFKGRGCSTSKVLILLIWFGVINLLSRSDLSTAFSRGAVSSVNNAAVGTDPKVMKAAKSKPHSTQKMNAGSTNVPDRLVLSIKTTPSRIPHIQPTLDSLLFEQTYKADLLYLVLPQQPPGSPQYEIPPFVQSYSDQGYLQILQPDHDFGPIDKMIHTLPVEQALYRQQFARQAHQYKILYLDDDMIYHPTHVQILVQKADQYPNDVVALSGGNLTSHFRQVGHGNPKQNQHPYLYYWVGGVDSHGDPPVDIVQGFMGVLIRLSFFNVAEFVQIASNPSFPEGLQKLDDFVISGYLESQSVTRRCVDGGLKPVPNRIPSRLGNLGKTMHQSAMISASFLQQEWGIWSHYKFETTCNCPKIFAS